MSCCDDDPCGPSSQPPRKSSKLLCPCKKCKEERGEMRSFQIAARAASDASSFARAGGNCLGKLTSMLPWANFDDDCGEKPKENDKEKPPRKTGGTCCCCNPKEKIEKLECFCDDKSAGSFECDDDKTACLCAATPDAASSISCFICECIATIGFFVIAIIVFWVSAAYHIGQVFWRFYQTQPKGGSKRFQSQSSCAGDTNPIQLDCTKI